ncbi:MAG: DUF2569 family protein [Deltaproteobacteria bacterium]|nr:DUF2569 family protein [Deltaproteobacteria bacterium]
MPKQFYDVINCTNCGEPNVETQTICPKCGFDFYKKELTKKCDSCGENIPEISQICPECGFNFPLKQKIEEVLKEIAKFNEFFRLKLINRGQYQDEVMKIIHGKLEAFQSFSFIESKEILTAFKRLSNRGIINVETYNIISDSVLKKIDRNIPDQNPTNKTPLVKNVFSSESSWDDRTLCIDESCIGVIGPDGKCKECGKAFDLKPENQSWYQIKDLDKFSKERTNVSHQTENTVLHFISTDNPNLVGVGGWLLLLCIQLTILTPLYTFFYIINSYDVAKPYLVSIPEFKSFVDFYNFIDVGFVIFSIYAGYSLWKRRYNAVKIAKIFLIAQLVYLVVIWIDFYNSEFPNVIKIRIYEELGSQTFRSVIVFIVWFSYLTLSKRVKATYL